MLSFIGSVIYALCKTTKHAFISFLQCFRITCEGLKLHVCFNMFKGIKFGNMKIKAI